MGRLSLNHGRDIKKRVKIASYRTDTGWILEVAIPQEFLLSTLKKRIKANPSPDAEDANQPGAPVANRGCNRVCQRFASWIVY